MLPSDAGGSSTPFLVPPVFGRRSDPKGLVPRLVQRTVHSGAHAPARPRVPIPPPLTCDRKVTNRPDTDRIPTERRPGHPLDRRPGRVSNRCSPPERRGLEKKSKKICIRWQPIACPTSLTTRMARRERGAGPYTFPSSGRAHPGPEVPHRGVPPRGTLAGRPTEALPSTGGSRAPGAGDTPPSDTGERSNPPTPPHQYGPAVLSPLAPGATPSYHGDTRPRPI